VQTDPIGLKGGMNIFSYTAGSPIRYFDNTGEHPVVALAAASAITGCITSCLSGVAGEYDKCVLSGLRNGGTAGNCMNECLPDPCSAFKTCATSCFAGGVVGGLATLMGLPMTGKAGAATGLIGSSYWKTLFPIDPCTVIDGFGVERPPKPGPVDWPQWIDDFRLPPPLRK